MTERQPLFRSKRVEWWRRHGDPGVPDGILYEAKVAQGVLAPAQLKTLLATIESSGVLVPRELEKQHESELLLFEDFPGHSPTANALPLPVHRFLRLAQPLTEAVQAIHAAGLLHNGLCPQALLISPDAQHIKLFRLEFLAPSSVGPPRGQELDDEELPFFSPERTGRTARGTDERSDLYSLGATFYALLVGRPPFLASDALALVHRHLAVQPQSPTELNAAVPLSLAGVVLKLLAKEPEQRYQTAHGLLRDLQTLVAVTEAGVRQGELETFVPGRHDRIARLQSRVAFVGRGSELDELRAAMQSVAAGESRTVLFEGPAGAGKSALVHAAAAIWERDFGGLFASGPFDALLPLPYHGIVRGLGKLFRQVKLGSSQAETWKRRILTSVGQNARQLVELVPDLARILGPIVDGAHGSPVESENTEARFKLSLLDLLSALAGAGQPLLLFLDNLQWADPASLEAVNHFVTGGGAPSLLLIGAYREEPHAPEMLKALIANAQQRPLALESRALAALDRRDAAQLLRHAFGLRSDSDEMQDSNADFERFAQLVYDKTQGNPLYVLELLERLRADEAFAFDQRRGHWRWDLEKTRRTVVSLEVAVLLGSRVQQLSPASRHLLGIAACVGQECGLPAVEVACELEPDAIQRGLLEAETAGVLFRTTQDEPGWAFAHNELKARAYASLPAAQRSLCHYRLARFYLNQEGSGAQDDGLFRGLDHFLLGKEHVAADELPAFFRAARTAARRAQAVGAYNAAVSYLEGVADSFGDESWARDHAGTFGYHLELLEARYRANDRPGAERSLELTLSRAKDAVERAQVHALRIKLHNFAAEYAECVIVARRALTDLGFPVPSNAKLGLMRELLQSRRDERRVNLHRFGEHLPLKDRAAKAAQKILFLVAPAAYVQDKILSAMLGLRMFRIAVKYGVDAYGVYGASYVPLIYSSVFRNYEKSYAIAQSLLPLRRQFPEDSAYQAHVLLGYCTVLLWSKTTYSELLPLLLEGFDHSKSAADIIYIGYFAGVLLQTYLYMGRSLAELSACSEEHMVLSQQLHFREAEDEIRIVRTFLSALTGEFDGTLEHVAFSADTFEYGQGLKDVLERGFFHIDMLLLSLIFRDRELGTRCLGTLDALTEFTSAGFHRAEYFTYACLQLGGSSLKRSAKRSRLCKARKALSQLAAHGPEAHGHRLLIADAELALCDGQFHEACVLLHQAIDACEERRFLHLAGILSERAADFYAQEGLPRQSEDYARLAHRHFREYGATRKVSELEFRLVALRSAAQRTAPRGQTHPLDAAAMIKAAHAIFESVEIDVLNTRLMELSMEAAGATRGLLFLDTSGTGFALAAEGQMQGNEVRVSTSPTPKARPLDPDEYPLEFLQALLHGDKSVILEDAFLDPTYATTDYVRKHRTRSLLGLPITNQGERHALLVLENNLTSGAFTPDRMAVLQVLVALVAISFTSAKLYAQQEGTLRLEKAAHERLVALNSLKDEFLANTSHELRTPLNGIIGLADSMLVNDNLSADSKLDLQLIVTSGKRLATLVNDILDYARLDKRELVLDRKSLDLRAIASLVCRLLSAGATSRGIELTNAVPPDLPPVYGDEGRLQQILFNLVGNAIKFTPAGGLVRIEAQSGERVTLSVVDTGIGIPEDKFEAIFQAFEQLDGKTDRSAGGTGLGLPIAKKLAELHGSELSVESKLGRGSRFSFSVPRADGAPAELEPLGLSRISATDPELPLETRPAVLPDSVQAGGARVLVVDDDIVNLRVLGNYLNSFGYTFFAARNGAEALTLLGIHQDINVVLLDVMMPQMNGYETCRHIRRNWSPTQLPVIMLTAKNRIGDLELGFEVGANDYLVKPFSREELRARLKSHLGLSQMGTAFARFVPIDMLKLLGHQSVLDVRLGDNVAVALTVMFADIRMYTTLAEEMTPEQTFAFLIEYFQRVGPIVEENGGMVNQYLGDGMMALFPGSPDDAVRAAVGIQLEIARLNAARHREGRQPIASGIGLHSGEVILGIIGDKYRLSGNVVSDAVNVASRVEGLTKTYGVRVAASGETLAGLRRREAIPHRFLDVVRMKGKRNPLLVYELFGADEDGQRQLKAELRPDFEQALQHYQRGDFSQASELFAKVVARNPEDRAAALLRARCDEYSVRGAPLGWAGVGHLEQK